MAPGTAQTLLSPAELSYLHTSLSLSPPIRPDGRSPTTFRPLIAETDILPATNGSARICFADGTEAIVGVKGEVEKTARNQSLRDDATDAKAKVPEVEMSGTEGHGPRLGARGKGHRSWVEMSIEIPGFRDDDPLPIFLAALLNEALHARTELVDKLFINERFHWKLYIDVLLLSPPLSYPVPLLSLTVHLALLTTALPALISKGEEDPLFNDDWEAAVPLYPPGSGELPPITLLVVAVGPNIIFDPSKEELAVADTVFAISLAKSDEKAKEGSGLRLLALRTVDSPSRTTTPGMPDTQTAPANEYKAATDNGAVQAAKEGVWSPPSGGMKRGMVSRAIAMCLGKDGVADEVLTGLQSFWRSS